MDVTVWARAGWLTAGTRMVEVDSVAVLVVADGGRLHVQHGELRYSLQTTKAGPRMAWVCPLCGRRCWRLHMAGVMLACPACCALAKRPTPPRESRASNTRHSAHQRQQAGQELARVVWGWVATRSKGTPTAC